MNKHIRVFISSTWQDLQPEREAVEKALHRMQDTAFAGMEYFGSRPETPREVSLAEVNRSDIYVGIFAHRYGSGITEDEYRLARARGIPCLIYFKDDNVPVPPAYIERDAAKVAKLEALKNDLKAHHTVSFFKSPDDLATQVVADLHNLLERTTKRDEVPTQPTPKYQIDIGNAQGLAIGDNAQVVQHFDAKGRSDAKATKRVQVQLLLEGEIDSFTDERRGIVRDILASVLKVEPSEVRIVVVLPGSIRLIVEVPEEALDRLEALSPANVALLVKIGIQRIDGEDIRAVDLRPSRSRPAASTTNELDFASRKRLRDLVDNIEQDLALLKEYEDELRLAADPRLRARYRREIEQLRVSAERYQREYEELSAKVSQPSQQLENVGTQLREMDVKLDALLAGQDAIRGDIGDMRQAVLARFDTTEQSIVGTLVAKLDQSQLATTQSVLDAIEAGRVAENELLEAVTVMQQAVKAIQQRAVPLSDPTLSQGIEEVSEALDAPKLDVAHKLKITVPLIPLLLEYEGEIALGSGLDLESAWKRLVAKVRGGR